MLKWLPCHSCCGPSDACWETWAAAETPAHTAFSWAARSLLDPYWLSETVTCHMKISKVPSRHEKRWCVQKNTFSFWISLRMCDILTFRASSSSSGTCGTVSGSTSSGLWKVSSVSGMHHLLSYCWFFLEWQEQQDGKRQDKITSSTFEKKNQSFTLIWRKITEKINCWRVCLLLCFCLCGLKFNFLILTSINNNAHTEVDLYVSQEHKIGCFVGTDLITKEKNRKVLVKRGLNDM